MDSVDRAATGYIALCPHQQLNLLVASCETTSKIATLLHLLSKTLAVSLKNLWRVLREFHVQRDYFL